MNFSSRCPANLWLGLGIAAAGLGTLVAWKAHYNQSRRRWAQEVVVITGLIALVLSVALSIPLVAHCFSTTVGAILAVPMAILIPFAVTCTASDRIGS